VSGDGKPRALVIEHERATPGGLVYEWLADHAVEVEELEIDIDDREVDPRDYDLIVPLGSEFAAFDDTIPWIEREKALLGRAHEADVAVLGICFGGQLLARVLGGHSFRAETSEIGWLPVRTKDPQLVPEGPWFQWHFDSFAPPPGAQLLAESNAGPQAYMIGRSLGVQFHPEITPAIMDEWVRVYRHELDAEGVDPDALLEETHRRAGESRKTSRRLLDTFIERVARIPRKR
jgi:GMP synthase-like glutamine amidotransferase